MNAAWVSLIKSCEDSSGVIARAVLCQAALAISQSTSQKDIDAGRVFPGLQSLRECAINVSVACVEQALEAGLARVTPKADESVREFVERKMYYPEYVPIYSQPDQP